MEKGSYGFDNFTKSELELDRLLQQARQMEPFESTALRSLGLSSGMKVLDVGCGPGVVSTFLAKIVGEAGEVVGIDVSDELLNAAGRLQQAEGIENLRFKKSDIYSLNFQENSFDFVYARLVFQHLRDPQTALKKILSVLKPGGMVCVADIDDGWLSVSPELDAFQKLVQRSVDWQAAQGGDRLVGHKLGTYLEFAGFQSVDVQISPITSSMIGKRNFLSIGFNFRAFATATEKEHLQAKRELEELKVHLEDSNSWGFLAIFLATGKK